jgi:heterodisulfide reductase subunit A
MSEKVGVFICDCGANIADLINTREVADAAATMENVAHVSIHRLWCSEEGRQEMKRLIEEKAITRVVVAACSPKQHEPTFQKVLASAGLNPYLVAMVNFREQIGWVTKDKAAATRKAISQLRAMVNRVQLQVPLEKMEIECRNDFLVLGSGIAGITAALTLAQKNRQVYLVEKEPWIGGKIHSYEDVFPNLECAPCMMEPKEDAVLHSERIKLLTLSEVKNIKGFFGNFDVDIQKKARYVDIEKCIGCGACFDACPVKIRNKHNGNMSERGAIFSAFAGVLPNAPVIDMENCLRAKGQDCHACADSCPFGAIDYTQKDEVISAPVGAIVVATGSTLMDISGMTHLSPADPEVYTGQQFERIISATGPTAGQVLLKNGAPPKSIAYVHCIGSRSQNYKEYCSGVCCQYLLKLSHLAKKKMGPENAATMYEIFSDWCMGGKGYQEFHDRMAKDGDEYIRMNDTNDIKINRVGEQLEIDYGTGKITVDMVVLAPAIVPADGHEQLSKLLCIPEDKNGFNAAENERISPASTTTGGIYIAGCCAGPKDVPHSVLQAQAAAGMALHVLVPGEKLELDPATAEVNEKACSGCRVCISMCPYQAISFDETAKVARVSQVLCKGCGTCASACPSGAMSNKHFTNEQIYSEIEGVLHE